MFTPLSAGFLRALVLRLGTRVYMPEDTVFRIGQVALGSTRARARAAHIRRRAPRAQRLAGARSCRVGVSPPAYACPYACPRGRRVS